MKTNTILLKLFVILALGINLCTASNAQVRALAFNQFEQPTTTSVLGHD
jgi:hypothetical protein